MVTPLLSSLRKNGGTLYTFSSASRDLTRIFTDDTYSFSFTNFACLNLPDIKNGKFNINEENAKNIKDRGIYLETFINSEYWKDAHGDHATHSIFGDNDCMSMALAENLQNYVMNFETNILNGIGDNDDYNNDVIRTVSERVFFNWLQKIGAVSFMGNDERGSLSNHYIESAYYGTHEGDKPIYEKAKLKDRLVQYIGKIDIINSVDVAGESYDEIYIHIPGSVGASEVRFKSVTDDNYNENSYYCSNAKIIGRNNLNYHPYDLSLKALYDEIDSKVYYGDPGYCIDFDDSTYGNNDTGIMEMNENSSNDFEFNCVLLYYTLTNNSTGEYVTNLYGVLFLEEITAINVDDKVSDDIILNRGYIQRYPKVAAGDTGNGNSYALKVDLKIDTLPSTSMKSDDTYTDINSDYAGAFEIYSQSLIKIQSLINKTLEDKKEIKSLKERIDYLENQLSLINQIPSITEEIEKINDIITYADPVINGESILGLISEVSNNLDALIKGKVSAKLIIDSNALNAGYGISIKKQNDNTIKISNTIGLYNMSNFYSDSELSTESEITYESPISLNNTTGRDINVYTSIIEGNNCSILYAKDKCNADLVFNIDGTWKTGQSLRIKVIMSDGEFEGETVKMGLTSAPLIKIFCENSEITKNKYIRADETNGLYEIEIICVNEELSEPNVKFIYDIKTK